MKTKKKRKYNRRVLPTDIQQPGEELKAPAPDVAKKLFPDMPGDVELTVSKDVVLIRKRF